MKSILHTLSTTDLDRWADQVHAPLELPRLLQRLTLATPGVQLLDVPSDRAIRLPGWDGLVESSGTHPFVPSGRSCWELSTECKALAKANDDYQKRTRQESVAVRSVATYIAVTARLLDPTKKRDWVSKSKQTSQWADVRLYDANDLLAWMDLARPVQVWFARQLGLPSEGVMDPERCVSDWASRARVLLRPELLLCGNLRRQALKDLHQFLDAPDRSELRIVATTREEAVEFVAAALTCSGGSLGGWAPRAVIVTDAAAWGRLREWVTTRESCLVIPHFGDERRPVSGALAAKLIVPLDVTEHDGAGGAIVLEPLPAEGVRTELVASGLDEAEARRLAHMSGGMPSTLQRLLGGVRTSPEWARDDVSTLVTMLLLGAWEGRNAADEKAFQCMGADPTLVERVARRLASCTDAPIMQGLSSGRRVQWRWLAPADAWRVLGPHVTTKDLDAFGALAREVLTCADGTWDMPVHERFIARIRGVTPPHSEALRDGIASTLALLSMRADGETAPEGGTPPGDVRTGAVVSYHIVREVLESGWRRWASLRDVLQLLAEAAPLAFLARLEESLDAGDDGVAHLLLEEGDFMAPSPHTGLLFALDLLGTQGELMPDVLDALARLAEVDCGGRLANRPQASIHELLALFRPRTTAPMAVRLAAFRRLKEQHPTVAWRATLDLLQEASQGSISMSPPRAQFRPWKSPPEAPTQILWEEWIRQVTTFAETASELAGDDATRWLKLVRFMARLVGPGLDILRDGLARVAAVGNMDWRLWLAVRGELYWALQRDAEYDEARVVVLQELVMRHEPPRLVHARVWLFKWWAWFLEPRSGNRKEDEARARKMRQQTIEELWRSERPWDEIEELLSILGLDGLVVQALIDAGLADACITRLLEGDVTDRTRGVLVWVTAATTAADLARVEQILRSLCASRRMDEAIQLAASLPAGERTWRLLRDIDGDLETRYWQHIRRLFPDELSEEEWNHGVGRLLTLERTAVALETAGSGAKRATPELAVQVLAAVTRMLSEELEPLVRDAMFSWRVEKLFEAIDRAPGDIPQEVLVSLEQNYLAILSHCNRGLRYYEEMLAREPAAFVELITAGFPAEGQPRGGEITDEQRRQASYAWNVLEAWRGSPRGSVEDDARWADDVVRWCSEVLTAATAVGRRKSAISEVAKMLARMPDGPDGFWPCTPARLLLEGSEWKPLRDRLVIAKRNLRGATSRDVGEGGRQEWALAASYRSTAAMLRAEWLGTAVVLDMLANEYERDARAQDEEARSERLQYGYDVPTPTPKGTDAEVG